MTLDPHIQSIIDVLVEIAVREIQNEERPVVVDQALGNSVDIDEERNHGNLITL